MFFHLSLGILMRRALEIVSLAALVALIAETARAFYGRAALTGPVPTHFNAAGNPDAWGSASMLWLLPATAAGLYLLMTWAARHPDAFNFPVRVTPFNRAHLQEVGLSMMVWIKAELLVFFASLQWSILRTARPPGHTFTPLPMPLFLVVIFLTVGVHLARIFRAGRAAS
jgi:hypothetical protein